MVMEQKKYIQSLNRKKKVRKTRCGKVGTLSVMLKTE